jgi:hypothetical protein
MLCAFELAILSNEIFTLYNNYLLQCEKKNVKHILILK